MIPVSYYIGLAACLFALSIFGLVFNRKNIILMLVCVELMLLAVNTNFIAFSNYWHNYAGEVFVFFILTVAAAEAAIGLAIVMLLFRLNSTVNTQEIKILKG